MKYEPNTVARWCYCMDYCRMYQVSPANHYFWQEANKEYDHVVLKIKRKGNIMKSDKSILDEMASETRANINAELLVMIELSITALSEITPLDKTLLNRIDRLKEKADELRDETK